MSGDVRLGYLPEERGLYKKESVIDVMVYFGQLKGLSRIDAKHEAVAFLERVKLSDKATTRLDKLSGGQQRREYSSASPSWVTPNSLFSTGNGL